MCDLMGCNAPTTYRVQFAEGGQLVTQELCAHHGATFLFHPDARVEQIADAMPDQRKAAE